MAKMNKSEAINAARNIAHANSSVNALTVDQINAMDYAAQRAAATTIMHTTAVSRIDTSDRYMGDVVQAFETQVLDIWRRKVMQLDRARSNFKNACSGLTTQEANAKVQALLTSMNVRGARITSGSMEVLRGDRDGATLYYRFDREDGDAVVNPDDVNHRAHRYALTVTISTCGTSYSPARMALVCKIQQELLDAANELTAVFERERVVYVYGGKVEAPAVDIFNASAV